MLVENHVSICSRTVFESVCRMNLQQREEFLKLLASREPKLANDILYSLDDAIFTVKDVA